MVADPLEARVERDDRRVGIEEGGLPARGRSSLQIPGTVPRGARRPRRAKHGTFWLRSQDRGDRAPQSELAAFREIVQRLVPIVTTAVNAAIEMKKAIIAYSIAVAPR